MNQEYYMVRNFQLWPILKALFTILCCYINSIGFYFLNTPPGYAFSHYIYMSVIAKNISEASVVELTKTLTKIIMNGLHVQSRFPHML